MASGNTIMGSKNLFDNSRCWVIIDLEKTVLAETDFTEISQGVDVDNHPVSDQWLR